MNYLMASLSVIDQLWRHPPEDPGLCTSDSYQADHSNTNTIPIVYLRTTEQDIAIANGVGSKLL